MTQEEEQQLKKFLIAFDVSGLGEGDINAGINTLATMLCTLANIARPGSGTQSSDGKTTRVGANLLISGALSSSLTNDDVINKTRISQNNLTSHLEYVRALKEKHDTGAPPTTTAFPRKDISQNTSNPLFSILTEPAYSMTSTAQQWESVTIAPADPNNNQIISETKIVLSASNPAELEKQLSDSHLAHPLVLLGLSDLHNSERMATLTKSLMDGRLPDGCGGKCLRGNLIINDHDDILGELAKTGASNLNLLDRLIWLVDGSAGPEVPQFESTASPLGNITNRFEKALSTAFGKRLDHKSPSPVIHTLKDIDLVQEAWVTFLKEMEPTLPGISGSARPLLATLAFGVRELTATHNRHDHPDPLIGIEDFARHLIYRMANARSLMTYSAKVRRSTQLQQSLLHKLQDGPHSVRDLTRRFNNLLSEQCIELLEDLERQGSTQLINNKWNLTGINPSPAHTPILEI